ncbi:hypothetical protein MCEMRE203_01069 [Candidatus Nanopelagicaceae bacterium]
MKFKKLALLTLIVSLAFPALTQAADVPGEQFVISYDTTGESTLGVVIEDSQKLKNAYSSLQALTADGTIEGKSNYTSVESCTTYGSSGCGQEKFFNYFANLDQCSSLLTTDCVQSVQATDASGKILTVNPIGSFPTSMPFAFQGNPAVNLPTGGSNFLVDIPAAPHSGGTQYLVVANMQGRKWFNEAQFSLQNFSLAIFAVSKISGNYLITGPAGSIKEYTVPLGGISGGNQAMDLTTDKRASCVQMTASECYIAWPLPQDIKFGVTLKLHTQISGWLHGRTYETTADISKAADGDQLVLISGKASVVPIVFASYQRSQLPKAVSDFYDAHPEIAQFGYGSGERDPVTKVNKYLLKAPNNYTESELEEVLAWYTALKDTAPYAATEWSVRSTGMGNDPKGCLKNNSQLNGIVSTNSNFFLSGPPVFNAKESSLDYKVASPHFLPNGDVFKGTYNLVIKSSVARCLYGFTAAPVSATVSIVSADGTSQVATTVLGERNGWLQLSAAGFTFSNPTVRVKLSQASAALKKISITCVKGKTSKKVSSVNPKCPSGYKKK